MRVHRNVPPPNLFLEIFLSKLDSDWNPICWGRGDGAQFDSRAGHSLLRRADLPRTLAPTLSTPRMLAVSCRLSPACFSPASALRFRRLRCTPCQPLQVAPVAFRIRNDLLNRFKLDSVQQIFGKFRL